MNGMTDFEEEMTALAEREALDRAYGYEDRCATPHEAMAEFARNTGHETPEQAWVLTDYDIWVHNPHYRGPKVPHPEEHDTWDAIHAAQDADPSLDLAGAIAKVEADVKAFREAQDKLSAEAKEAAKLRKLGIDPQDPCMVPADPWDDDNIPF